MVLKVLLVPKRQQTTRVGEDVMKLEFSYTNSGSVNGSSTMENGEEMAQEYSDINYHIALQFNIPIYLKGKGRYILSATVQYPSQMSQNCQDMKTKMCID